MKENDHFAAILIILACLQLHLVKCKPGSNYLADLVKSIKKVLNIVKGSQYCNCVHIQDNASVAAISITLAFA